MASPQARGLVALRICLGVFFVYEALSKVGWFLDSGPLVKQLEGWLASAGPWNRWYLQIICLPGAPIFGEQPPQMRATATAAATPLKPAGEHADDEEAPAEGEAGEDFDDDLENSLSLAAIEAELKPKVVETFDTIADSFKRLRRLQEQDIEFRLKNS